MGNFYKGFQKKNAGSMVSAGSTDMTISEEPQRRAKDIGKALDSLVNIGTTYLKQDAQQELADDKVKMADGKTKAQNDITKNRPAFLQAWQQETNDMPDMTAAEYVSKYSAFQSDYYQDKQDPKQATNSYYSDEWALGMKLDAAKGAALTWKGYKKGQDKRMLGLITSNVSQGMQDYQGDMKALQSSYMYTSSMEAAKLRLTPDQIEQAVTAGHVTALQQTPKLAKNYLETYKFTDNPQGAAHRTAVTKIANRYDLDIAKKSLGVYEQHLQNLSASGVMDTASFEQESTKAGQKLNIPKEDQDKLMIKYAQKVEVSLAANDALMGLRLKDNTKMSIASTKVQDRATMIQAGLMGKPLNLMNLGNPKDPDTAKLMNAVSITGHVPSETYKYINTPMDAGNIQGYSNLSNFYSTVRSSHPETTDKYFKPTTVLALEHYRSIVADKRNHGKDGKIDNKLVADAMAVYNRANVKDASGHSVLSGVLSELHKKDNGVSLANKMVEGLKDVPWSLKDDAASQQATRTLMSMYVERQLSTSGTETAKDSAKWANDQFHKLHQRVSFPDGVVATVPNEWAQLDLENSLEKFASVAGYTGDLHMVPSDDYTLSNKMVIMQGDQRLAEVSLDNYKGNVDLYNSVSKGDSVDKAMQSRVMYHQLSGHSRAMTQSYKNFTMNLMNIFN